MNRGSFLKSLVTLIAAPKVIAEINFDKIAATNIATNVGVGRSLISDLQLLTPQYYKQYIEKYGSESYTLWNEWLNTPYQNLSSNVSK